MLFDNANKKCLKGYNSLAYDEACIDIISTLQDAVSIFGQYDECHKCDFQNLTALNSSANNTSIVVNTRSPLTLYYVVDNVTHSPFKKMFYEHYRYGWNITTNGSKIAIKEPADNAYLPILMAFVLLFCFGTLWYMVKCIYKNCNRLRQFFIWNSEMEEDLGGSSPGTPLVIERTPSVRKHPHRIKSIDVFRGLAIILMIFVNYGGGKYWFFQHSVWNGITVADLVFPWFLWVMGLSLTVSFQSKLRRAVPRRQMVFQVIRRSLILVLLGVIINSNKNMSTIADLRFPGVLQRIGVAYLVVGILEVIFMKRTEVDSISVIHDVVVAWPQWLFVISLIVIHTCVTFLADVPGCGKGYLGPGGILGTLTSILTVYLGVQAGKTLNTYQSVRARVLRWTVWGVVTGLVGGALCSFSRDNGPIPMNKQLWSLSFVFVTAGMAFIIQAFLFVIVDILRKWGGRPFFYPGMNAIILYVGHELMKNTFPFAWKPTEETHGTYLFMNLWGTFLWVSVSIFLYKRNIFLTI
ncbi:hypothetical protein NQ315_004196 [Exocentrus adspersus]|uniref:Heparan-alpha-glucosaminide N-acetyltransferase catalytic domain-containing protein n=1 Tax=Exocentrus adspersus TaxID=1586481 RepID=A0AAV8W798_9CUCU|nr:hypothetical protein NQ315_004196 [Exocentrus adspersus]